jgi:hypothetical protein
MLFRIVGALVALCLAGSVAAAGFSSLEERMSEQEFRAAGLDKLSPEELAALNEWLRTRAGALGTGAGGDDVGFRRGGGLLGDNGDAEPIGTYIVGTFTGWSPGTILELSNGQAWEILDDRGFSVGAIENPAVTIKPAMLGSWLLQVDGYNRTARVRRVR